LVLVAGARPWNCTPTVLSWLYTSGRIVMVVDPLTWDVTLACAGVAAMAAPATSAAAVTALKNVVLLRIDHPKSVEVPTQLFTACVAAFVAGMNLA
jgi:hypothetical protein